MKNIFCVQCGSPAKELCTGCNQWYCQQCAPNGLCNTHFNMLDLKDQKFLKESNLLGIRIGKISKFLGMLLFVLISAGVITGFFVAGPEADWDISVWRGISEGGISISVTNLGGGWDIIIRYYFIGLLVVFFILIFLGLFPAIRFLIQIRGWNKKYPFLSTSKPFNN